MDTIYALASARGKAGVAVVRLSGPEAWAAAGELMGRQIGAARQTQLCTLSHAGTVLDQALVLPFAKGASFTGEQVVELHLHGSTAVVAAVLVALSTLPGLRLAQPGEFTRRALENGCLDLAQVEGLAALIDAETEAQRKQALRVLSGAIGQRAEAWRSQLLRAAALLEATIDFADEDVPVDVTPEVLELIASVQADLHREADGTRIAERIRDGFEVAIVGLPNAGKSTLLNALAGREAAITSEHAGTTRDVIEVRMDIAGLAVTLLDTAGLRISDDAVETIGINRALERASGADLRVFLSDEQGQLPSGIAPSGDDLVVRGKADLAAQNGGLAVSGKTGLGIAALIAQISTVLETRASTAATLTHERHRIAVMQAMDALALACNEIEMGTDRAELAALYLRQAIMALESLVGRIDVEQVLGEIFARFCIGK